MLKSKENLALLVFSFFQNYLFLWLNRKCIKKIVGLIGICAILQFFIFMFNFLNPCDFLKIRIFKGSIG